MNLEVQEALKARGLGAERFTEVLAKLLRSKNERIQLEAMREGLRLLNAYPSGDEEPVAPVTLIFDPSKLILPGEEPDFHNTHRQIAQPVSAQEDSGDARLEKENLEDVNLG